MSCLGLNSVTTVLTAITEKFAPELYIRLNDEKVLSWLQGKVQAVANHLVEKMGDATVSTFTEAKFAHENPAAEVAQVMTDGE